MAAQKHRGLSAYISFDRRPLMRVSHPHEATRETIFPLSHPPTQEATAVQLWRNLQWVACEALAPGLRSLTWLLRRSRQGGHASAGSAEDRRESSTARPPQ
jgi:hypothetical protein